MLADELAGACLDVAAAADVTRTVAAAQDVVIGGERIDVTEEAGVLVIHEITDPSSSCARSDVTVTGAVYVTLRGPGA